VNARRGAVQYRSVSPVNLLNELYEEPQNRKSDERLDSKEPGGLGFGPALDPRCPRHLGLAMSEIGYGGESRPCVYNEGPKSIDISSASARDLPSLLSLHVLRAIDEIPERPPLNS